MKVVPRPAMLSTSMPPPWRLTVPYTAARPSPVPVGYDHGIALWASQALPVCSLINESDVISDDRPGLNICPKINELCPANKLHIVYKDLPDQSGEACASRAIFGGSTE